MDINIPSDLSLKDAISHLKRKWVDANIREDESSSDFAKRMNVSYRTVMRWRGEYGVSRENLGKCLFCKSTKDINLHHVYGKSKPHVIPLCNKCHVKFHSLNSKYKKPNNDKT